VFNFEETGKEEEGKVGNAVVVEVISTTTN
jgi:hypothetical protein